MLLEAWFVLIVKWDKIKEWITGIQIRYVLFISNIIFTGIRL